MIWSTRVYVQILPDTGVEKVITTSIADCYNPIIQPLKPLEKIPVPDTFDMAALLKKHPPEAPAIDIDIHNDLVHLAYTGGTTGVSKGVMLTHYNVVVNVCQFSNWFSGAQIEIKDGVPTTVFPEGVDPLTDRPFVQDQETALVVVPWFHAMGTVGYLNNMVYGGNTMVVFPNFEPQVYIDAVKKYNATMLGGPATLHSAGKPAGFRHLRSFRHQTGYLGSSAPGTAGAGKNAGDFFGGGL